MLREHSSDENREVFCIWPQEVLACSARAISVRDPIVLQLKNEWEKKWRQSYWQCFLKGSFVKRNREGTKGRDCGVPEGSVCVC